MVCRLLRILSGVTVLTLAGCHMHSPNGYGGGTYGYPSGSMPMNGAPMMGPSTTPYVNPPGSAPLGSYPPPYYNSPSGTMSSSPTTIYPYPSSTTSQPPPYPATGTTLPRSSTGTTISPPPSNATRPTDRLPPDSDEYPDTPAKTSEKPMPPDISGLNDEADFKAGQGNSTPAPKSKGEEWLENIETEGIDQPPPSSGAKTDPNVKKSSLTEDGADEFSAPTTFTPEEDPFQTANNDEQDAAVFWHDRAKRLFRGKAQFDEDEQEWFLRYMVNADVETGEGIIYLADHAKLSSLKNGARILVEGEFDPKQADKYGQPMLVIKGLSSIIPED